MKLQKLKITQFRGVKDFECDFSDITKITGTNGLGKTTILDSIMWLLCDETFTYGKQNDDNKNKHNHRDVIEVEGTFAKDNGKELVLKREYFEKWKENEDGIEEFVNIKNNCMINGASYSISEYLERIRNEIGIEHDTKVKGINTLRLLLDYSYLNSIDYKISKKYIESLIGIISDEDILSEDKYSIIKNDLLNQNCDIGKTKSKFNNDKNSAGVLIKSITSQINVKKSQLKLEDLSKYDDLAKEKQTLLNTNIASNNDYIAIEQLLNENSINIQTEKENALNLTKDTQKKVDDLLDEGRNIVVNIKALENNINSNENAIKQCNSLIEQSKIQLESLREQYANQNEAKFKAVECPNCHTVLNSEEEEKFNANKNKILNNLKVLAENQKKLIAVNQEEIARQTKLFDTNKSKIEEYNGILKAKRVEYFAESQKLEELEKQNKESKKLEELNAKKVELEDKKNAFVEKYNKEIQTKLLEIQTQLTNIENSKNLEKEIENLENQLKVEKNKQAMAETQLVLLEDFKAYKNNLIKENTKKVFANIEFQLAYISPTTGNMEYCCHASYKDVEFNGVNSGNQYPLGVEVIEDIKKALNVKEDLPILFDRLADIDKNNFAKCLDLTKAQIIGTEVTTDEEIKIIKENR